jgi:hypothetical protein
MSKRAEPDAVQGSYPPDPRLPPEITASAPWAPPFPGTRLRAVTASACAATSVVEDSRGRSISERPRFSARTVEPRCRHQWHGLYASTTYARTITMREFRSRRPWRAAQGVPLLRASRVAAPKGATRPRPSRRLRRRRFAVPGPGESRCGKPMAQRLLTLEREAEPANVFRATDGLPTGSRPNWRASPSQLLSRLDLL